MRYVFLTAQFYKDYANCPEIEQKPLRPYIMLLLKIDNLTFALPMRSHIKHKYAYFTDKANGCGIDYSKAVVITNINLYVDSKQPYIRPNEYKSLLGKNFIITKASGNSGCPEFDKVILNALNNLPLPVYGYGLNVNDWLYVEDNC